MTLATDSTARRWLLLIFEGALVGAVHLALVASGGLLAGLGPLAVVASVSTYVGWFVALRALCELGVGALGRRRAAGYVFVLLVALVWLVFLAKWARAESFEGRSGLFVGAAVAAILIEVVGIGRTWSAGGRPHWKSTLAVLVLSVGLAVASPFAHRAAPSDATDLIEDRLEALRPAASERFAQTRWNVLLITVDTLRADHLGCYGYPLPTSPVVDSLATAGMLLDNAVTVRPKTSPSFASILTGVYPARHGIHAPAMVLRDDLTTLAERLSDLGYATGASVTNGNLAPDFGFDQGFASFEWGLTDASAVTDRGLAWLDGLDAPQQPWHLWVHYTDPHTPYDPPAGYTERFLEAGATSRSAREIAAYDGEIRYTDEEIGRLLRWLHARPEQLGRTLILFTADHGESLGEHDYWFEHGLHPYEASSHVPLIVVAPTAIGAGRRSDALISNVDLVPTLLDALDAPVEEGLGGRSFLPLLAGLSDHGPRNFAFIEAGYGEHIGPGRTRALRRASGKTVDRLVDWARWPRNTFELIWAIDARLEGGLAGPERYDLSTDRHEQTNLAGGDAFTAAELKRLRSLALRLGSDGFTGEPLKPDQIDPESLRSLKALGYIE